VNDLSLDRLPELRRQTDLVSVVIRQKLDDYLDTLRPLLAPQRVIGKHLSGASGAETPGAERAFKKLQDRYAAAADGYGLPRELRDGAIDVERDIQLHPWSYPHTLPDGSELSVSSPVRWVLTYRCAYSPDQIRHTLQSRRDRRPADLLQFVLSALTLQILLEAYPGIARVFSDLRFELISEPAPGAGPVPLVGVRAAIPSFRPPDDVLERSTQLSGVPAFIELIDPDALDLRDPLAESLKAAR